jgi:hypothetical protein
VVDDAAVCSKTGRVIQTPSENGNEKEVQAGEENGAEERRSRVCLYVCLRIMCGDAVVSGCVKDQD